MQSKNTIAIEHMMASMRSVCINYKCVICSAGIEVEWELHNEYYDLRTSGVHGGRVLNSGYCCGAKFSWDPLHFV